jgi:predicted nucleic acid-binding protein
VNVYVDASVLLRFVFGQPDDLGDAVLAGKLVTSALTEVECLRTVDRARLAEGFDDAEVQLRRKAVFDHIAGCEVVGLDGAVLTRASMPLPTALGVLDAMHLATASLWREEEGDDLTFATHDRQLGRAAAALGFTVVGLP